MNRIQTIRHLRLSLWVLAWLVPLAFAGPLRSQEAGPVVLVGLNPAGALVPVGMELVRRPGELRLEPGTGTLSRIGAVTDGRPALLAFDPSTGTLLGVDIAVVRGSGEVKLDPRTGALSADGLVRSPPDVPGPLLVGFDATTLTLVPVEIGLALQAGSFALDPRSGAVSPPPRGPALVGFDTASGALVPVEASPVRGRGGMSVDPSTGRVSMDATAQGTGPVTLLGIGPDGTSLVAVDLELVNRGVLGIDAGTGLLVPPGQAPTQDAGAGRLSMLGVHSPTGALTRVDVETVPMPGNYAVDMSSGTVRQMFAGPAGRESEAGGAFVFGGGLDLRQMLELKDVLAEVGSGATGADGTGLAPGVHGFAEYRWRAISLGLEAGYSVMNTEVVFPQGLQTGDLRYAEVGGSVKIHVPLDGPISPYGTVSILRAWIEGDFEINGLTEQRTHETARSGFGAGFDYWGTPQWGFRAEALYNTTFEASDAADHIRWSLGLVYSSAGAGRR